MPCRRGWKLADPPPPETLPPCRAWPRRPSHQGRWPGGGVVPAARVQAYGRLLTVLGKRSQAFGRDRVGVYSGEGFGWIVQTTKGATQRPSRCGQPTSDTGQQRLSAAGEGGTKQQLGGQPPHLLPTMANGNPRQSASIPSTGIPIRVIQGVITGTSYRWQTRRAAPAHCYLVPRTRLYCLAL